LKIAQIDEEENLLAVKGAIPGRPGTLLEIITTKEIETVQEEEQEKKGGKKEEKPKEEKKEDKPKEDK